MINFNTRQLNSSIFNAILSLATIDKQAVVDAFDNSMDVDCEHEVCQNIGKDIANFINSEDWQGLSNFLDHGHKDQYRRNK